MIKISTDPWVTHRQKKSCWIATGLGLRAGVFVSGVERGAHDESDHADSLLLVEHGFPRRHFAKTIGDSVVDKVRLIA